MVRAERLWTCEPPDSLDSSRYAPSSKESDEDDFDCGAFVDPTNVTNCPKQFHRTPRSHGRTDHGIKKFIMTKSMAIFWAGDIHQTCGTRQSTTIGGGYLYTKGIIHWRQMVTTDTFRQHHDTKFVSQCFLQMGVLFQHEGKRAGESVTTSASAKQKSVHHLELISRTLCDKNADMDLHAVLPPEYRAGSDLLREEVEVHFSPLSFKPVSLGG